MVNERVRHPSGKRLIKNNQQCARYGHHAVCLLCGWHLEMAGRDWFLRSPLFPDQRIITQTLGIHGEGDQTGECSFKQRTILQITVNWGWNVKKKRKEKETMIYRTETSARCRQVCIWGPLVPSATWRERSTEPAQVAAWAECRSQALAVPRSRLESRRTASEEHT